MASLPFDSNPVLTRELRASLRNARAFGLLALYVAGKSYPSVTGR